MRRSSQNTHVISKSTISPYGSGGDLDYGNIRAHG